MICKGLAVPALGLRRGSGERAMTTDVNDSTQSATKPVLPWSTAGRIAWRELRAGKAKFFFVLLSVAIGVAALTGVRGFSTVVCANAAGAGAEHYGGRFVGADVPAGDGGGITATGCAGQREVRTGRAADGCDGDGFDGDGRGRSGAAAGDAEGGGSGGVSVLRDGGVVDGTEICATALTDDTVVVDDNLLVRLRAKVGDRLKIGGRWFRIAAVIEKEPDRMTAGVGLGPRVMMTRRAMDETGLLQPGSRATERYLFALGDKLKVADVRAQIEKILPDAQVTDFRETSPTLTQGVDRATGLLSLICLVAMVLGAIGVAMAMRAHLQQRIEILAIMKSIGARSADILRIYLLQTLLLGVGGALIGVVLGLGVEYAFPTVLGRLLPLRPEIRLPLNPVLAALGTGILTTLLFCLPPLLDVRNVRPSLVLRRMVESGDGAGWMGWLKEHKLQLGSVVVILAGLGGIAAALSDSMLVGKWFAICLAGLLVFILGLSAGTLRALRAFLSRTRLHLHSALRHGLANLYRPGNQSAAVLAALGTGVMLILSVFLMQRSIVNALHEDVKPDTPNLFLIDMSTEELPGIRAELAKQAGVIGGLEAVPIVSARVESIDGTPVDQLKVKNYPKRLLRNATLSWADGPPRERRLRKGSGGRETSAQRICGGGSCGEAAESEDRIAGDVCSRGQRDPGEGGGDLQD